MIYAQRKVNYMNIAVFFVSHCTLFRFLVIHVMTSHDKAVWNGKSRAETKQHDWASILNGSTFNWADINSHFDEQGRLDQQNLQFLTERRIMHSTVNMATPEAKAWEFFLYILWMFRGLVKCIFYMLICRPALHRGRRAVVAICLLESVNFVKSFDLEGKITTARLK